MIYRRGKPELWENKLADEMDELMLIILNHLLYKHFHPIL
jgi:hypothetical protein